MYRTVVVTEPSREYDPSEYDEAELEFMCQVHFFIFFWRNNFFAQRDISIDMGVDDVDETAIMAVDNVEVLDSAINETADMEYEMEMYCQADDGAG